MAAVKEAMKNRKSVMEHIISTTGDERMEVPCCGGIEYAVKKALQVSGKRIPWSVVTISTEGKILE